MYSGSGTQVRERTASSHFSLEKVCTTNVSYTLVQFSAKRPSTL